MSFTVFVTSGFEMIKSLCQEFYTTDDSITVNVITGNDKIYQLFH